MNSWKPSKWLKAVKRNALVSAACAVLFSNIPVAATAQDIGKLLGDCANGDQKACDTLRSSIGTLTNQALLAKIAVEAKDWDVRTKAIAAMDGTNPALRGLAGNLGELVSGSFYLVTGEAIARLKLAIQEPRIRIRFPGIILKADVSAVSQFYSGGGGYAIVSGESVSIMLSQAGKTLAKKDWSTHFPDTISASLHDKPWGQLSAKVRGEELLAELLHNAAFTQDDLAELSSSEIPELRMAAAANLTDQASLAKIALEDKNWQVATAAGEKLTDQPLLAKVAVEAHYGDFRRAAVEKLTDQALLAKIAVEDENPDVRSAAVSKLTDEAFLAKIAVKDKHWAVRSSAVEKLTDQALLAKIAVEDKDEEVRRSAVPKLTDQTLLTKIAVEDKNPNVRSYAKVRLAQIRNDTK